MRGGDAIVEVPADRWRVDEFYDPDVSSPARMTTKWGGFIDRVDQFDAAFFGISPREAVQMAPQQRLLLEIAWEAIERAGIPPSRLRGTATGVFVGVSSFDYYERVLADSHQITGYTLTGNAYSITANRLSFLLDLSGPSMAVDTACSSSLVALHLACQSIRAGESTAALVAGVHVMLSPWVTVACSKGEMMAQDGRCKTFDSRANGYVRGEGIGVVLLKPLEKALGDGDPVIAVIRGTAVNQDGRSNGLTAPNQQRQRAVLKAACVDAGIEPAQISYVEAHGTGTRVGDPIELEALGSVLREGRPPGTRCLIGAGKTNIGHLEAAAGVAGLIKGALVVQHRVVPRNLHFERPNPLIDFDGLEIAVPLEVTRLAEEGSCYAGVNSFGFGGTNAHVVLQSPPSGDAKPVSNPGAHLLPLSAKTEPALRQLAERYARFLEESGEETLVGDVCFTAGSGRDHFAYRLGLVGRTKDDFSKALHAFASGEKVPSIVTGSSRMRRPLRLGFMFTGQGSQYAQMGRELYGASKVFRETLRRCDETLRPILGRSLIELMHDETSESLLHQTAYAQPALFAVQAALTDLLSSWGITPSAVLGHSLGEFSACYAARVFDLSDGVRLVAERGRAMQELAEPGSMTAVFASESVVRSCLQGHDDVQIGAINSSDNVVISGRSDTMVSVVEDLHAQGLKTHPLPVSHAFHSALMQPAVQRFRTVLDRFRFKPPSIAVFSNVTGKRIDRDLTDSEYWCRHALEPVRFADALRAMHEEKPDALLEIGPRPLLSAIARRELPDDCVLETLNGPNDDSRALLRSVASLYVRGAAIDWRALNEHGRIRVLPTYPFQRQRYWISDEAGPGRSAIGDRTEVASVADSLHPFLARARRQQEPDGSISLTIALDLLRFPYLNDHRIQDDAVLPATAYIEIALAAAGEVLKYDTAELENMRFRSPLILSTEPRALRLTLRPGSKGRTDFVFASPRSRARKDDVVCATGTVRAA
jgi:acyl transferase domain-containing protein